MKIIRPSVLITGLLAACVAGCSSATAVLAQMNSALTQTADEYWNAVSLPDWAANPNVCPNWKKSYGPLHPEARAATTIDQFNRQEQERLKGKCDSLWDARVHDAKVLDDTATVSVTLRFGGQWISARIHEWSRPSSEPAMAGLF